ncbi:hypothetical protein DS909_08385 [Phaeobacter gallaeciensis]|uniref:Uncharacterized protein n=1 Tax=Phaeobacter gallaeciensis TaxID=60890 RepID=A0A366X626_9RHOB|nr:hypothetical protein [Phaeobacter gallaeciensis]RBW57121.1 hypothetical protein DS909_08385 [Phaeobacter gallaeciensis]
MPKTNYSKPREVESAKNVRSGYHSVKIHGNSGSVRSVNGKTISIRDAAKAAEKRFKGSMKLLA